MILRRFPLVGGGGNQSQQPRFPVVARNLNASRTSCDAHQSTNPRQWLSRIVPPPTTGGTGHPRYLTSLSNGASRLLESTTPRHQPPSLQPLSLSPWHERQRLYDFSQCSLSTTTPTPQESSTSSSSLPSSEPPMLAVLEPPESLPPAPPKGWLVDLYETLSLNEAYNRKRVAEQLFQAASYQASNPLWYGPGRIPRHFRNRHALLCLHVWLLHKRLISDTYDPTWALKIQEELFAILWEDTTVRVREQGVTELAVAKNVQLVQQYSWIHFTHYDHVYTELLEYPLHRYTELKRLIARHILLSPEDIAEYKFNDQKQKQKQQQQKSKTKKATDEVQDDEDDDDDDKEVKFMDALVATKWESQLRMLAWYIDVQYQNIVLDWPDADYRDARVIWTNVPNFLELTKPASSSNNKNKLERVPPKPVYPDDVVPAPWMRSLTNKGDAYYWNTLTDETTFERPTSSSSNNSKATTKKKNTSAKAAKKPTTTGSTKTAVPEFPPTDCTSRPPNGPSS